MKLICELQESVNYEFIEEEGSDKPKQYFIEGIFMQSEKKSTGLKFARKFYQKGEQDEE